jgi:GNAT superfamily N-acetyltransferase
VIEVRVARPDEFGRVGDLTVAAYRLLPVDHLWGGYDAEILDTSARAERADVLVAVVDGDVVGSVTFVSDAASPWSEWTETGEVQFRLLAVDAAARGRGVGEALVRACITRAGRAPIMIHTTPWMDTARRMYDRLGFVRRPDRDVPYEEWHRPEIDNLPAEWVGQSFLAYALGNRNRAPSG